MNEYLKSEFIKLKESNVISSETYDKILDYYKTQELSKKKIVAKTVSPVQKKQSETKPKIRKKINITFLLSVISAFLIAGGIISLIAYNWYAIPRAIKALSAFIICIAPPVLYEVIGKIRKKNFEYKSIEFFAIVWDLLFGASIAFISQIYRMPSNPIAFIIVWSIVSIGITYSLKSQFTFYFSLLLILIFTVNSNDFVYGAAVVFYPLLALLFFFAKEKKVSLYIWVSEILLLSGFVFANSIPGLWIIAYASMAVLLINYGKSRNDDILVCLGYLQAIILAVMLDIPYFWKSVGFSNIRDCLKYQMISAVCDSVVCLCLYACSLYWAVRSLGKDFKSKLELFSLAFVGIIYLCCLCIAGFDIYVSRIFMVLYLLIQLYIVFRKKNSKGYMLLIPFTYAVFISQLNFVVMLFAFILLLTDCYMADVKNNAARNIPFCIAGILLLFFKVNYVSFFNEYYISGAYSDCKVFDCVLLSSLFVMFLGLCFYRFVRQGLLQKRQYLQKGVFIVILIISSLLEVFANFTGMDCSKMADISLLIFSIICVVNVFAFDDRASYVPLCIALCNYILINGDYFSPVLWYSLFFLFSSAVYYNCVFYIKRSDLNAMFKIMYGIALLAGLYMFIVGTENIRFDFTDSALNACYFLAMILMLYVISIIHIVRIKIIESFCVPVICTVSLVFTVLESLYTGFNFNNYFIALAMAIIFTKLAEIVLFKNTKDIYVAGIPVLMILVQLISHGTDITGFTSAIMLSYALYFYMKECDVDRKLSKSFVYAVNFVVLIWILCSKVHYADFNKSYLWCAFIYLFTVTVVPVYLCMRNKDWDYLDLTSLALALFSTVFFVLSLFISSLNMELFWGILSILICTAGLLDFIVCKKKAGLCFIGIILLYCFAVIGFHSAISVAISIIAMFVLAVYVYLRVYGSKLKMSLALFTVLNSLLMLISFVYTFKKFSFSTKLSVYSYIVSLTLLLILLFILPCILTVKKRLRYDYSSILHIVIMIVFSAISCFKANVDFYVLNNVFGFFILGIIIAFNINGLFVAYKNVSIKMANYHLLFLCICLLIRFFMFSSGLMERGIVCIGCGIVILIMNIMFSKKLKAIEEEGESNEIKD